MLSSTRAANRRVKLVSYKLQILIYTRFDRIQQNNIERNEYSNKKKHICDKTELYNNVGNCVY